MVGKIRRFLRISYLRMDGFLNSGEEKEGYLGEGKVEVKEGNI